MSKNIDDLFDDTKLWNRSDFELFGPRHLPLQNIYPTKPFQNLNWNIFFNI
jgi:hypothetical protein